FQFWLNADDRDVERYLKTFTFLSLDAIAEVMAQYAPDPAARTAQRRLAAEVTRMVHGPDGLARAERATGGLFGSVAAQELPAAELLDVFSDVPSTDVARAKLEGEGMGVVDILADAGVAASRGEARRLIAGGGVSLNGARVTSPELRVRAQDAIDGQVLLLRKGKKENRVVRLVG
ncbi:MAG TPA: S4 domain-containing protein, partial [Longimicrobium sp.]|nr:S4 domain-containing protein [Longimicrobium sp.]